MKQKVKSLFRLFLFVAAFTFLSGSKVSAYSFTWSPATGTLTINVTNATGENITVCLCSGGDVTINGAWLKDANGNDVHVAASAVTKLIINGGSGIDIIDLDCIAANTYPNLAKVGDVFKIEVNCGDGDDEIRGSHHADFISMGNGYDYVEAQEGDDEIWCGGEDDEIWGGDGNDVIYGEAGYDELDGDAGNDKIYGGDDDDELYGSAGDDTIYGDAGEDFVEGGEGNDTNYGGNGNDEIYGGFSDSIVVGEDNDKLYGEAGNDHIFGAGGTDEIYGGAGNDVIDLDFEDTVTDGGTGDDTINSLVNLFLTDQSSTPLTKIITDESGNDGIDFSKALRGIKLDLGLQNTSQTLNSAGYNLNLNGCFENIVGSPFDDIISICPLTTSTRTIDGGPDADCDTLNFDAMGKVVINSGVALTCDGYLEVLYSNFEVVNINNPATGIKQEDEIPTDYVLNQNYPNPFNPVTTISYKVPGNVRTTLKVFDLLGNEIATIVDEEQSRGNYKVNFNAANLTSGIYFYRLNAGNFSETKSMLLLK
ncbi:MAG: hypothetical protein A3J84_00250 [Ignavibacteria bacterium RIFOXYA2_FULL_37_17]|nr:MAG: hypothetical protein A3J84_00250 [Ignavibacteria bacterium RIFOXYA2_FULL_37_17]